MSLDVLIADQDIELGQLYCRFLTTNGFSAATVSGGVECLRMLDQQNPRVLVLDHELRWGGGDGVLACLREEDRSVAVILTTWSAPPERIQELLVPPVVLCLRKFFALPALLDGTKLAMRKPAIRRIASLEGHAGI